MTTATPPTVTPYDRLSLLKQHRQCRTTDLLVLARSNDPFFAGQPYQLRQAHWFAHIWREAGYDGRAGIHIRRVHYRALSIPGLTRPNGEPYENTTESAGDLYTASKVARYLGFVDPLAFIDQRNPDPHLYAFARFTPAPVWSANYLNTGTIDLDAPDLTLPSWPLAGYDYAPDDEPYHVEVWIEKSTMDDVLLPICREHGVNLVTSIGFQSVTSAIALVQRAEQPGKPTRILYISDFDPAGVGMPVGVARQIEFWMRERAYGAGTHIRLKVIGLTRDQVARHHLPRIPIKESDTRRRGFEERNGQGAVELDALEALHPGELERIVREAIAPFRDPTLRPRLARARQDAEAVVRAERIRILEPFKPALEDLNDHWQAVTAQVQEAVTKLQRDAETLGDQLQEAARSAKIELPPRPRPRASGDGNDSQWLFDSQRGYFEQLTAYRAAGADNALQNGGAA